MMKSTVRLVKNNGEVKEIEGFSTKNLGKEEILDKVVEMTKREKNSVGEVCIEDEEETELFLIKGGEIIDRVLLRGKNE